MERVISEFLELVQIDGCFGDERGVADALIGKLKELGCTVSEDDTGAKVGGNAGNVTGVLEGTKPGSILFTSHMDRVQNGYGIKPQFTEDGRITSDGTTILAADDLSGVAAILEGVRRVKEEGLKSRIEILSPSARNPVRGQPDL
jgi:tripeptide aminopeptidase